MATTSFDITDIASGSAKIAAMGLTINSKVIFGVSGNTMYVYSYQM